MILPKIEQSIEDCIDSNDPECNANANPYIEYVCGKYPECKASGFDERQKRKAVELAKHRILHEYHLVGLTEYYEWSLLMLEFYLPYYMKTSLWEYNKNGAVREALLASRTINKKFIHPEVRQFLETNVLKYEIELYEFAKNLFLERLRRSGAVNPKWFSDSTDRFQVKTETGKYPPFPEFLEKYVPMRLHKDLTIEFYKYREDPKKNPDGLVFKNKIQEMIEEDKHKPTTTPKPLPPWANPEERIKHEVELLHGQKEQLIQQINIMQQLQSQQEQMEHQRQEVEKINEELEVKRKAEIAQKLEEKHKQEEKQRAQEAEDAKKRYAIEQSLKSGWGNILTAEDVNGGAGGDGHASKGRHEF